MFSIIVAPLVEIPDEDSQLPSEEYVSSSIDIIIDDESSSVLPLKRKCKKRKFSRLKKKTDSITNITHDSKNESSLFVVSETNLENFELAPISLELNSEPFPDFVSTSTKPLPLTSGFLN